MTERSGLRWPRLIAIWMALISAFVVVVVTAFMFVVALLAFWRHLWGAGVIGLLITVGMLLVSIDLVELAQDYKAPTHPPILGGIAARIRRWWWLHIRRYEGELCQFCGRPYRLIWWAPTDLWNQVADGRRMGLCCPTCFDSEADRLGVALLRWKPMLPDEGDVFVSSETRKAIAQWHGRGMSQ